MNYVLVCSILVFAGAAFYAVASKALPPCSASVFMLGGAVVSALAGLDGQWVPPWVVSFMAFLAAGAVVAAYRRWRFGAFEARMKRRKLRQRIRELEAMPRVWF